MIRNVFALKKNYLFELLFWILAPVVIRRYLHSVNCDVAEAKKLIEHSYTLRTKYPNIFYDRDPLNNNDVQKIFKVA